jgi:hypothetical protein
VLSSSAGTITPRGVVWTTPSAFSAAIRRRAVSNGMRSELATALMLTGRRSSSGGGWSRVA